MGGGQEKGRGDAVTGGGRTCLWHTAFALCKDNQKKNGEEKYLRKKGDQKRRLKHWEQQNLTETNRTIRTERTTPNIDLTQKYQQVPPTKKKKLG